MGLFEQKSRRELAKVSQEWLYKEHFDAQINKRSSERKEIRLERI